MLTEAVGAARAGDRSRARDLLARLLRTDSANAEYWIWMSAVVDTERERVYCLESAIKLDPTNRAALRGLVVLGARKPAQQAKPIRLPKRDVASAVARPENGSLRAGGRRLTINWPLIGTGALGLVVFLVAGGIVVLIQNSRRPAILAPTLPPATSTATATPLEPTETPTPIPVETRIYRTPVPTDLAGTPIAFLVEATPTATPIIGITPHPSYDAYQAGVTALQRGEYQNAVDFMNQVIKLNSNLPDAYYFKAEALRLMGDLPQAIGTYDKAVLADRDFVPAYLGRGRARAALVLASKTDVKASDLPSDFDSAISRDPLLADAYIEKAKFLAGLRLWKTEEEALQAAIDAGVRSPTVYIMISQAQFNRAEYDLALQNAIDGSASDPTNLQGYLAVGRASVALGDYGSALWPLQTYVVLRPDDATGWAYLSRAYLGIGQTSQAFDAAQKSVTLNDHYAYGYLARALAEIASGSPQQANTDLLQARRYGSETYELDISQGRALYMMGQYVDALNMANTAITLSSNPEQKGQGYALRALIYEATNPPLLDEARLNWQWILDTQGISDQLRSDAQAHLDELTGKAPTRTTTPVSPPPAAATVSPTPGPSPTPSPTP